MCNLYCAYVHKVLMHSMLNSTSYTEPYEVYLTYPPPLGSPPIPSTGSNLESNVHALKRTVVERRMFSLMYSSFLNTALNSLQAHQNLKGS